MAKRTCSVSDCDRTHEARGWCHRHYTRWRRHGDPEAGGDPRIVGDDVKRFWSKVDASGDCWEWTGVRNAGGYGAFDYQGRPVLAHRWAYEHLVGPIPEDLQLDHLCRNRPCVNPDHLEPVTNAENGRRGSRAKLTAAQAATIRKLTDVPLVDIADRFGIAVSTARNIQAGRRWVA